MIDANSGEILSRRNHVHTFVDGAGQVFIPNPINTLNDPTLTTASPTLPDAYRNVILNGLLDSGPFTLRGSFVNVVNMEAPSNTPPSEAAANGFVYPRTNAHFNDVMLYYHIDRIQVISNRSASWM